MGTAQMQGQLWGSRARDWAELGEPTTRPTYVAVFDRLGITAKTRLLDVGCGAGLALSMARDRGAVVTGLDASEALVEIARRRVPGSRIEVGDMEALPFPDDAFDVVTSFTALQFAGDRVQALREAGRVIRPGGFVAVLVWGSREHCESTATFNALAALMPPPSTPPGQPIGAPGVLENLMEQAGLTPVDGGQVDCPFSFPNVETTVRALRSPGMVSKIEEVAGQEAVIRAIRDSLNGFVQSDGSVIQKNQFRWVLAEKRG